MVSVGEGDGTVQVCATLSGEIEILIAIILATNDSSPGTCTINTVQQVIQARVFDNCFSISWF